MCVCVNVCVCVRGATNPRRPRSRRLSTARVTRPSCPGTSRRPAALASGPTSTLLPAMAHWRLAFSFSHPCAARCTEALCGARSSSVPPHSALAASKDAGNLRVADALRDSVDTSPSDGNCVCVGSSVSPGDPPVDGPAPCEAPAGLEMR